MESKRERKGGAKSKGNSRGGAKSNGTSKERTNLTYDISVHKQEKTDEIKNSIGRLNPLIVALKIHEVLIEKNLEIKKKNLPTDAFFKGVLLKESRRRSTVCNDSDSEYEDIVDSDYKIHLIVVSADHMRF